MSLIHTLAEQGHIWSGHQGLKAQQQGIDTGYAELNAELPGGGWPLGAISEILYSQHGSGELRLLLPALAQLSKQDQRWQLWLNTPYLPCAPALQQWQLNTQRILLAHAHKPADLCHSLEKSLKSGGCQAAIVWLNKLDKALMRRIQLAAEQSNTPVFMLRPIHCLTQPSVAALRIKINRFNAVDIIKRRSGWPVDDIGLELPLYFTQNA